MTTPPNPDRPPERPESERGAPSTGASGAADPHVPPGPPPQYHPGPYGYPPMRRSTNGFAVASLVLGIIGIVFLLPSVAFFIFVLPAVLALIFGYVARKQIRQQDQDGAGLATAGIVLGFVAVGLYLIFRIVRLITGF